MDNRYKKKAVLLNSPKLCGKGVLCEFIENNVWSVGCDQYSMEVISCKDKLYTLVQELFCLTHERFWEIYGTRDLKETPLPEFRVRLLGEDYNLLWSHLGYSVWLGTVDLRNANYMTGEINLSVREALIYVSECIAKPRWGAAFFGVARAKAVLESHHSLILDDSAGFDEEISPLIEVVGQENIMLIRIHRDGFDFTGDSRRYVSSGIVDNTVDIENNGTEQEFLEKTSSLIFDFMEGDI